jgi:ketosteroid isomerase-like protein
MKPYQSVATFDFVSTLLVLSLLAAGAGLTAAGEFPKLTGPNPGQPPPTLEAENLISSTDHYDEPDRVVQTNGVDGAVNENARDRRLIEEIVHDSIAWALNKDRARLESIIAHDDDYFSFHPEGLDGVHGYAEFSRGFDLWMDPRFEATRTEVRNFRCHLSQSGEVAWFSAILDDCYRWDGRPGCWKDTRWTGVLEHRDGRWQIVQMHFSFAADRDESTSDETEEQ